jgi:NAD(P)-dependent dehydrogenase (short-subunit alcohol dehydrogenase family)
MQHDFSDKYFLITGAGRGLGQHLAEHLAGYGATVGVADIDGDNAERAAAKIRRSGGEAFAYDGDIADRNTFIRIAGEFSDLGGRVDAIVNNAMLLKYGPI